MTWVLGLLAAIGICWGCPEGADCRDDFDCGGCYCYEGTCGP